MKYLAISFFTISVLFSTAQTAVYHENFDAPSGADSVSTYNSNSNLNSVWKDTNAFWSSPNMSYHVQTVPTDIVYFETNPFTTLGKRFVRLKFSHICKIYFLNNGFVQVSVDSGNTWINLDASGYNGNSPNFNNLGYFYENSYPVTAQVPYWGGPTLTPPGTVPTNNWWASETFDISNIAGTVQANGDTGYADVRIRFALDYGSGQTIASGWFVDDLLVEGSTENNIGLDEERAVDNISIMPNPASTSLRIERQITSEAYAVSLIDAQGNIVQQFELNSQSDSYTLDISGYPNGLYTLHLMGSKNVFGKKLIIQH